MSPDGLKSALESAGWRIDNDGLAGERTPKWYAWKRGKGLPDCECNDKPPSLCIKPWDMAQFGHGVSAEIDITGESGGQWYKLQAYGISADTLMDRLPEVTDRLGTAWAAIAERNK